MSERIFPIHNGKLLSDLDANGHKIKNIEIEVSPEVLHPVIDAIDANTKAVSAEVKRATDAEAALDERVKELEDAPSVEVVAPDANAKEGQAADAKGVCDALKEKIDKSEFPYSLVNAVIEDNAVSLQNRAIIRVVVDDSVSELTFTFPEKTKGVARDFFIRLEITGDTIPTISFVEPNGDAVAFDVDDDSWAEIEQGVNILMFTDTGE